MNKTYSEKLRDPRWQKKRLELLESSGWKCKLCGTNSDQLHVHHKFYKPKLNPWDYENWAYEVLCAKCHELEQDDMITAHAAIAKHGMAQNISLMFFLGTFSAGYLSSIIRRISLMPNPKKYAALLEINSLLAKFED